MNEPFLWFDSSQSSKNGILFEDAEFGEFLSGEEYTKS